MNTIIWTYLRKLSAIAMAICTSVLLCSAGYFFVKKEIINSGISDDSYRVNNPSPNSSSENNLSNSYFGSTFISDKKNTLINLKSIFSNTNKKDSESSNKIGLTVDPFIIYQLQELNKK